MPQHSEKRKLPYTAQQMYDLVADVARYPEFLPWTAAARIRARQDFGDHEVMEADLVISFKVFRERFGSRVVLWPARHRIETDYLDGPFKHLHSHWELRRWMRSGFRGGFRISQRDLAKDHWRGLSRGDAANRACL